MFGAISKLFRKSAAAPPPAASPRPTDKRPPALPTSKAPASKGVSRDETPARGGVSKVVSNAAHSGSSSSPGETISIPYASIIRLIPNELWGKLAPAGVAGHQFTIARATAVAQLATGAVKVKFGDLRKGAPSGVFLNSPAEDNRLIELPLSEILSQLHPDAYSRRQDQIAVHVDQEVPDVFGANGSTGAPVRVMQKKEVGNTGTVATRQKSPNPVARAKPPTPEPTPQTQPAPTVPPANVVPLPPAAKPPAPAAPAPAPAPAAPIRLPATPVAPTPTAAPKATTSPTPPIPKAPTTGARPLPKFAPASTSTSTPAPAPATSGFTPIAPIVPLAGPLAQGSFTIDLDALAEQWPDAVRQELAQLKIPEAKVALPPVDICEGLKRGRIQYPWRTLRSWIQPTPLYAAPSPHDDLILELPLRTLTPSFLQFIRENPVNRQTAAADNITEFFLRAEQSTGNSVDVLQSLLQEEPAAAPPAAPPPAAPSPAAPVAPTRATAPAPSPAPSAGPTSDVVLENGLFCIPVSLLAPTWPDAIKQDIAQFGLANARLDIPIDVLEAGLRSGKIEFNWAELCAWLNPASKTVQVSINGEQRLTLPIQLIGPLFIKLRPAANRRKAAVMSDIPDLFNAAGVPQPPAAPEPGPAAEAAPAPEIAPSPARTANPPGRPEAPVAAPQAVAPRPAPTNLSELFGEPTKKSWTPNEIVQRSTRLPGVAGALIALQDGLLVASSLPANLRIEMIAAFVPQIFGRLNQYSKELNLGDATATSFTIPAGTLQIYNAGLIYFAALSKPGENLPIQDLQLIAAELSRHTK